MSRIMNAPDFLETLGAETAVTGAEAHVPIAAAPDGRPLTLPVKLLLRPRHRLRRQPLILTFAGSVDQAKRGFPTYAAGFAVKELGADAVVLALADPSLWLSGELRTAWYEANRLADVPRAIGDLVNSLTGALSPSRLIFVGSSNGAHGALVQSTRFPGCVCIAFNPITRISGFYQSRIREYLSLCWGGLGSLDAVPAGFVDDCGSLYRKGHAHSVVLVQNATDPHLLQQGVSFAAQVRDSERLLFLTEVFPDLLGHALPGRLRVDWVTAAALAPTAECLDIASTYAGIAEQGGSRPRSGTEKGGKEAAATPSGRDLDLAARLVAAGLQK